MNPYDNHAGEIFARHVAKMAYRELHGPVCARCVHSTFTPADLPALRPGIGPENRVVRHETCPVRTIRGHPGDRVQIIAQSGVDCALFVLDPEKAS